MKTIGLIGGMSWESTMTYYQLINQTVKDHLGGLHSAKILLYSVDFFEIEQHQSRGEWEDCARIMTEAAIKLEQAGADFIVICTNTMHKVVPQMEQALTIPILHIARAAAHALKEKNIKKAALLGTKYTMTQEFYKKELEQEGIEVLVPDSEDIERINRIIFEELCLGVISENSKKEYLRIIDEMGKRGAEGVILGCTEIGLLIRQEDTTLPVFDTAIIHGKKAALAACK
ncbi:aspartate/glutamate racemase family protein [Clostridium sp. HBUAS56010]|uniref:aspartate/glutamate racemase family protein n=1 Tax=Clostridium sp. HBUAS56010 TaxID=2571127 RepID=UPI0011783A5E|nr:aspartate/glutamate racemase family protein [Clostridium sp. HBUAS56010]